LPRPRKLQVNPGDKYGRLTVVAEVEGNRYSRRILCRCDCGMEKIIALNLLLSGNTKSCGCLKREMRIAKNTSHGLSKHCLYSVWSSMKDRCLNSNIDSYKNYGARGISVCDEWMDFANFYNWAINNGYKKGLTIERVDYNGNYDPSNCTWIPFKDQSKNRRSNHWIEFNGEIKTMSQWARDFGFKRGTIKDRIERGWPIQKALTTPIKSKEVI
jgi:hypothetical protein